MNQLYIEIKYAKQIRYSIDRGKIKNESPFHLNGRCPVCGDSVTNKTKARFHILEKSGSLLCYCHNCSYSASFSFFLKVYHPNIYSEYVFERYKKNSFDDHVIKDIPKQEVTKTASDDFYCDLIVPLGQLDKNHLASLYVASRKLPDYKFFFTDKFFKFASRFNKELSHDEQTKDEARLIIPFFDKKGNVYAFQGRDLSGKSKQKYITIIISRDTPKIFGIGSCDFKRPLTIVEGPLDSLFLDNCIAAVNASLVSVAKKLSTVINSSLLTIVFDCEPRNKTIVSMYADAIKLGYKVVIWPNSQKEKDINEMVLAGLDPRKIIKENTYSGLAAQIQFQQWKKI